MPDNTYKGWSNQATWCMYQCLTIDEDTYRAALQHAKEGVESLRHFAEEYVKQGRRLDTEVPVCCATDLLQAAITSVNWREILAELIESLR